MSKLHNNPGMIEQVPLYTYHRAYVSFPRFLQAALPPESRCLITEMHTRCWGRSTRPLYLPRYPE